MQRYTAVTGAAFHETLRLHFHLFTRISYTSYAVHLSHDG
jgi:hypothetical protein